MSEGKKPDPRKRRGETPHATHFKVLNGKTECGYKAGELYGCYGHRTYAHRPCLIELTGGELSCPFCAANDPVTWRGYLPIWDRDFALRYALIGEPLYESVDMIPHKAQLIGSRDKSVRAPLVIRAADAVMIRGLPEKRPWCDPVDMYAICRVLWKDASVDAWWATTGAKKLGLGTAAAPLDLASFGDMTRGAAARVNRINGHASANEQFAREVAAAKPAKEPSTNGHAKKPNKE